MFSSVGALPGAGNGGKRRLQSRNAALAFNRIQQRRLFAAFISARAGVDVRVEIEPAALNILAQIATLIRFRDGALHALDLVAVFAADVDVALVGIHREAADQHAFEQRMRVVLHQQAIFAGAGLALVRIHDDVLGFGRVARHKTPLHAGRKARAAAPAQGRSLHFVNDLRGGHPHCFAESLVAFVGQIGVDGCRVGQAEPLGQDSRFERIGFVIDIFDVIYFCIFRRSSISWFSFSGVTL